MTTYYEIPLSPTPQTFRISLAGITYAFTLKWNWVSACWVIDIADATDKPMVSGIPMVTGVDLLSPYAYLGFGGSLVAQTDNAPDVVPTFDDLGSTGHLYWIVQ